MLTIACVNWCDYQGRGNAYVSRLQRMVERNVSQPYQFRCFTEHDLGTDLKGWWVKMKLTRPGLFAGPVAYFDLDVSITANIDHLIDIAAQDTSKLWARDDFGYSYRKPRKLDPTAQKFLGGRGCINSSVMLWHSDALAPAWEQWRERSSQFMADMHGDQNAISSIMCPTDRVGYLPDESIQSFKYHVRNGEKRAPIVVFHGTPKPHEVREFWDAA